MFHKHGALQNKNLCLRFQQISDIFTWNTEHKAHQGLLEIFAELRIYRGAWISGAPVHLLAPSTAHKPPVLDLPLHYLQYSTEHFSCQHNQFLLDPKPFYSSGCVSTHTLRVGNSQERRSSPDSTLVWNSNRYVLIKCDFIRHTPP